MKNISLTEEQIKSILDLRREGKTTQEIADTYGVSLITIISWVRKLKKLGYFVPVKKGRPPVLKNILQNNDTTTIKSEVGN